MRNFVKAVGDGVAAGARRFVRTKNVDKHVGTVRSTMTLHNSARNVLAKAEVLAIFSAYMAYKASPYGMAKNGANALRRGFREYHATRNAQFEEAMEDLFGDLPPDDQKAIRRAVQNSAQDGRADLVVGPMTFERVQETKAAIGGEGDAIYF